MGTVILILFTGCNSTANPTEPQPGVTAIGLYPAPMLGIVIDKNMRVVSVESDSAAESSGIQNGDTLTSINSKRVTKPDQARQIFYTNNPTRTTQLILNRNGKEIKLEIMPTSPNHFGATTPTPDPSDMAYF